MLNQVAYICRPGHRHSCLIYKLKMWSLTGKEVTTTKDTAYCQNKLLAADRWPLQNLRHMRQTQPFFTVKIKRWLTWMSSRHKKQKQAAYNTLVGHFTVLYIQ